MEESPIVPSESSDVVISGEVWVDLNSISDSDQNLNLVGKCCYVFQFA